MPTVEILSYTLAPGSSAKFHRIMVEESIPLHRAHGIDVVLSAPSHHGQDAYGLIRAFPDVAGMERVLEAFYASAGWRTGPRERIIALIRTSARFVVQMPEGALDGLRAENLK